MKRFFVAHCFLLFFLGFAFLSADNIVWADAHTDWKTTNDFLQQIDKQRTADASGAVQAALQFEQQHTSMDPVWLEKVDVLLSRIYSENLKDNAKALSALDTGMARSAKPEAYLPLAIQKYQLLIHMGQNAQADSFYTQTVPRFLEANRYYFTWSLAYFLPEMKRQNKPQEATSVLLKALAAHPSIIDYPFVGEGLVQNLLRQPGHEEEALSYAKLHWMTCDFDSKWIVKATDLLQKAWMAKDLNAAQSTAFLKAQQDKSIPNPLKDVKLPALDAAAIQHELEVTPDTATHIHPRVTLLVLEGKYGDAMLIARRLLLDNPTQNASQAAGEIARIFKAADLNMVRANAFLQYFKTGQGDNPLEDFFKEHPVGTASSEKDLPTPVH